ncbi:hypothetical protein [Reyranella sp.]|uniref:hypothetical protein n=1 Tax=Reyranella sp. TaxID=1929291 RepID=UPI003784B774
MIFVTVIEPRGRLIYVDSDYGEAYGPTPTLVTLDAGTHCIQTTTGSSGKGLVDFENEIFDVPDFDSATINLVPVVPAKPKGSCGT